MAPKPETPKLTAGEAHKALRGLMELGPLYQRLTYSSPGPRRYRSGPVPSHERGHLRCLPTVRREGTQAHPTAGLLRDGPSGHRAAEGLRIHAPSPPGEARDDPPRLVGEGV